MLVQENAVKHSLRDNKDFSNGGVQKTAELIATSTIKFSNLTLELIASSKGFIVLESIAPLTNVLPFSLSHWLISEMSLPVIYQTQPSVHQAYRHIFQQDTNIHTSITCFHHVSAITQLRVVPKATIVQQSSIHLKQQITRSISKILSCVKPLFLSNNAIFKVFPPIQR